MTTRAPERDNEAMRRDRLGIVFPTLAVVLVFCGLAFPVWILSEGRSKLLEWPSLFTALALWAAAGALFLRAKVWAGSFDERKRAQRAYYSLGHGTELVYWIGEDNLVLDVNDRLLQILGYQRQDLLKRSPTLIDHAWIEERRYALWAELASGGNVVQESSYVTRDGRVVPVEQQFRYFVDLEERYLCVFARDISDERRVAQELEHTKGLFEIFLEGLSAGAFVRDRDGKFIYFNEMFRRWTPGLQAGRTLWEVYGAQTGELFHKEDLLVLDQGSKLFVDGDPANAPNGPFLEILKFPILLPSSTPLVAGLIIDVTQRRLSELRLAESNAFLEAVIHQSPIGIILLDGTTTNIRTLNKGAREILGLESEKKIETPFEVLVSELFEENSKFQPWGIDPIQRAFSYENVSGERLVIRRPNGDRRFVLVNSGPIFDGEGKLLAAIVALQDITELHEAEAQLEQMNRRLEAMVEDRTRELMESNEALKTSLKDLRRTQNQLVESEKLASLGGLVAGVAHEINTPVGVGVTAASFLREKTEELQRAFASNQMRRSELEAYVVLALQSTAILLSNLERASNLIKSFKMISADQSSDPRRIFALKAYLEDVFVSLRPPDKQLRVDLKIEGDPDLQVTGYPGTLSQIVTNLFMNSCLHGFEGRSTGSITLGFEVRDERLIFVYTDDGKGMEESVVKRVFEPFFTTRRDLGGTGLGMNIVFNLVHRKLGGGIQTWSQPGRGVRFTIDVPLVPPAGDSEFPTMIAG